MIRPDRTSVAAFLSLSLLAAPLACSSNDASNTGPGVTSGASGSANASAPSPGTAGPTASASAAPKNVVVGVPFPADRIAKAVNPKDEEPYSGPKGTLRGTIRITGDAPPELNVKLPSGPCRGEAAATHGKLFRVGQGGTLADALVAVTGYRGYVPPKGEAAKMTISRCSFARRTLVATYGQRVEVSNLDKIESYMPYLDGAPSKATLVAIPGGDAVRLYPQEPGHYQLKDTLPNPHMVADVFVLAYSTTDVTGLDGKYEITGIPVGQVEVNAMLPATKKSTGQRLEIKEGDNTLDLTLTFDAKTDDPARPPAAPATSGSAKPDDKGAKPPGPKG